MVSKIFHVSGIEINFHDGEKKQSDRIISYDKAIEEIGFGKVQISVIFVTFLVLANTLSETMGISFVIPAAVCDLQLTPSDKGLLSSMSFLGIMVSSHIFGFLADTQGRRIVVLSTLLGSTISTVISVFMQNFIAFLVLRFISGIFVGGYSAVMYAYLGEYTASKYRASMLTWVTTSVGFVSVAMPLLAFWIMSYSWSYELYSGYLFRPWRLLILIYAFPGILAIICLYKLRESPKLLLSVRKDKEALEVVKWIFRTNKGKKHGEFDIAGLEPEASEIAVRNVKGIKAIFMSIIDQTLPLLKPPFVINFTACCCLHFGLFTCAGGLALFMPDILNKLAIAQERTGMDLKVCDVYNPQFKEVKNVTMTDVIVEECNDRVDLSIYTQTMYVGVGYIIGFIILSFIIKPSRRTLILVTTYAIAAIGGLIITFMTSQIAIIGFFTIIIFFAGVNVPVVNSAAVDIFPTYLRSMAVCCSMLFGRLGTFVSSNIIGIVIENYCQSTFFSIAGVCIACCAIAFILPRSK
ncbi:hypothetical protein PVAND_005848 [Polypedilum vanderplanki]|uniref:Major facilitator superfamily (MFS) profile domain-containing protein n=1 Tax=Polypedilum vanderplanki TaxID=319348 RepID=A0A9J6C292_POLVA|nr:hypothetical protein PVAND_005848 [Polypedilum vanderplanki]